MSLLQTTTLLHGQGVWSLWAAVVPVQHIQQSLAACLSLLAIYYLGMEIYDRNCTDRRLRLAEHNVGFAGNVAGEASLTVKEVPDPGWILGGLSGQPDTVSPPPAPGLDLNHHFPTMERAATTTGVGDVETVCDALQEDTLARLNRITANQIEATKSTPLAD